MADPAAQTLPTTVVIPTIGRPSLELLMAALLDGTGPRPSAVVIVDDRPADQAERDPVRPASALGARVVNSGGIGPAGARNRGWRLARTPWVSFLDDDVLPGPDWLAELAADLDDAEPDVAGIQGVVTVPLPGDRQPTDWERGTAGLAEAAWITADMSYRRRDLVDVGGFDERFPRAFREDADLALRVMATGRRLSVGKRRIQHPVRPADFGPRSPEEVVRMTVTSTLIPPAAVWHAGKGRLLHRRAEPWPGRPDLVLFDRDGTLVHDVPYNGDPQQVRPVEGARAAVDLLRDHGVRVGIITNQSGIALGRISAEQAAAVNAEVERRLGPFDTVMTCPHAERDGCECRKPSPRMVQDACRQLEVPVSRCVVVGDIRSDIDAARNAGATGILVPTAETAAEDVLAADLVCPTLLDAAESLVRRG